MGGGMTKTLYRETNPAGDQVGEGPYRGCHGGRGQPQHCALSHALQSETCEFITMLLAEHFIFLPHIKINVPSGHSVSLLPTLLYPALATTSL